MRMAEKVLCVEMGGRCIAAFAHRLGIPTQAGEYKFEAVDGLHTATLLDEDVSLEMVRPQQYTLLGPGEAWIHTGSPHYLRFSEESVAALDVVGIGRAIRYSETYSSIGGTNANFVNILDHGHLQMRTYERGVEDETLSCGTGATACAYVYLLTHGNGLSSVKIDTPGGKLTVKVEGLGAQNERVFLQGPAHFVFNGSIEI